MFMFVCLSVCVDSYMAAVCFYVFVVVCVDRYVAAVCFCVFVVAVSCGDADIVPFPAAVITVTLAAATLCRSGAVAVDDAAVALFSFFQFLLLRF